MSHLLELMNRSFQPMNNSLKQVSDLLEIVNNSKSLIGANERDKADEIFVSLRRLGKEVTYAKYKGESHNLKGYANQIDFSNRMISWFDKWLRPGGAPVRIVLNYSITDGRSRCQDPTT